MCLQLLQLTPKNVETQYWIAKTVWQRIPGRRARNSKTPTTKTVQMIARNDQLPLTGRPQMTTTSNVGHWCAAVLQVQRSHSMKTSIHQHGELKLYSVSDVKPVELARHAALAASTAVDYIQAGSSDKQGLQHVYAALPSPSNHNLCTRLPSRCY